MPMNLLAYLWSKAGLNNKYLPELDSSSLYPLQYLGAELSAVADILSKDRQFHLMAKHRKVVIFLSNRG